VADANGTAGEAESTSAKTRKKKKKGKRAKKAGAGPGRGRRALTPFPPVSFMSVLPLAEAIQEHGAGQSMRRITLFDKLDKSPESSASRMLITNSGRYGVTKGSYKSETIELTPEGAQATSPDRTTGERLAARFKLAIEGVALFKQLYDKHKGNRLPAPEVMRDGLSDIGDEHRTQAVDLFLENAKDLGLLRTMSGAERVVSIEQALEDLPNAPKDPSIVAPGAEKSKQGKSKASWQTTCFVIGPIEEEGSEQRKHSDMILEALIRRALENDWDVVRSDQITQPGMISGQVIDHLLHSGLVIADLSFHNPNVFYELALRHVVGKPTVHLIRKGDKIPFDLKDFRTIAIDTGDKYELVARLDTYKAEIGNHVRQSVAEGSDSSNPIKMFAKGLVVTFGSPQPKPE
jgi:hypothetical protein